MWHLIRDKMYVPLSWKVVLSAPDYVNQILVLFKNFTIYWNGNIEVINQSREKRIQRPIYHAVSSIG